MYVSSIYDEIKCLTCGVYQERSEGEANPAQKLMLFSLLFMLQDFSSCVSTTVFAYCTSIPQPFGDGGGGSGQGRGGTSNITVNHKRPYFIQNIF